MSEHVDWLSGTEVIARQRAQHDVAGGCRVHLPGQQVAGQASADDRRVGEPVRFLRFREVNGWHNESWNLWLQYDGNEVELASLRVLLGRMRAEAGRELPYTLDAEHVLMPEYDVERLAVRAKVKFDAEVFQGLKPYLPKDIKVIGTFICPRHIIGGDLLANGAIRDLFTEREVTHQYSSGG